MYDDYVAGLAVGVSPAGSAEETTYNAAKDAFKQASINVTDIGFALSNGTSWVSISYIAYLLQQIDSFAASAATKIAYLDGATYT